jgi:hypothetical protein
MAKSDFKRFVTPMGEHRLFGHSMRSFLDSMPERRWTRRNGLMEQVVSEPYKGITTDGNVIPDLYSLRDEGAPTEDILNAVSHLKSALSPDQWINALLAFDSLAKNGWQNGIPDYGNHGFRLDEVTAPVREATMALLRASTGAEGYDRIRNVMRLHGYLGQLVGAPKLMNEYSYRVHFFGKPSSTEPWGWQLSGHHLCVTFFLLGRQMVMTPIFMGVEPNTCDEGDYAGASAFQDEEYNGLLLAQSLDPDQRRKAVFANSILEADLPKGRHQGFDGMAMGGAYRDNQVVPYEGILGDDLTPKQWQALMDLAQSYLKTLPDGPLAAKMADLEAHKSATQFCWAGGVEQQSVFYYRIQSPVTMIEFDHHWGVVLDNPKPERFHIHTTVRTPNGNDYGIDLLRLHLRNAQHKGAGGPDHGHRHGHNHGHHQTLVHGHSHDHDHKHD